MPTLDNGGTKWTGSLTLSKQKNTVITLSTDDNYVDKNIELTMDVQGGVTAANTASADADVSSDSNSRNISGSIGTKSTTAPSSGYYLKVDASGSGSSKVTTAGWVAQGNLPTASTTATKYFPVTQATITQNTPTVNASGLVTATAGTTAGYTPANASIASNTLQLSTQGAKTVTPTESEQTAVASGKYTTGVIKVGAISSTYVGSGIAQNDSEDLAVNENTVTAPAGYYANDASATIGVGTVTSGTATISSLSKSYNSTSGKFDITGSATVSAPTVGTAGYVSSTKGTKNANTNGATVSATLDKIAGSISLTTGTGTGTDTVTKKPVIAKVATPSGVTNAANGDATTTAPSSGVYVAVKSDANTGKLTATPSVTAEGYGTSAYNGLGSRTATYGASASDTTYIPIKTGSASTPATTITSNPTITVDETGLITASVSKSQNVTPTVSAGYVTSGTAGAITVSGSNTNQLDTVSATTYNVATDADRTIAAGKYLVGAQTIRKLTTSGITATNIKDGAVVKVGDSGSATRIHNVTGTFTDASTVSSGQTAATASQIRSGYSAWVDGAEVKGSLGSTSVSQGTSSVSGTTVTRGTATWGTGVISSGSIGAATFANEGTSGQSYVNISDTEEAPVLVSGDYLYINKGYTDNLKISLAKLVPDGSDVKGHGEYILSGHSAYDDDGTLVAGTIPTKTSANISASGKTVTVPAGYYATNATKDVDTGAVTTSLTVDGISTYFDAGTSSDKNVTLTPKYTNTAGYIDAHSTATNNGGTAYYKIKTTSASVSGKTVSYGTGWITEGSKSVADGTITNNTTLPSGSSSSGTINRGSYIKIGAGYHTEKYYLAQNVSNGTITNNTTLPSGSTSSGTVNRGSYIKIGAGYYSADKYYLAQANSGTKTITASGNTDVNGYVTASVAAGAVTSGSATISSLTKTYNSTSGKFDITGSANVSAPTVGTAGFISSTDGTRNANNGGATVSATIDKIVGSTTITGTTTAKPSISKTTTPSGVTNAASGNATTTAPSSGVYVAVQSAANTGTLTATPSVTTAGYGDSTNHGIAGNTATVGATASDVTYVPITTTSASVSGKTVSYGNGWITSGSKSVADGAYSASVSSHSITTAPVVTGSLSGTVTNIGTTSKPSGTDGTDYWTITPSGSVTTTGVSTAKGKATIGTAGYIATGNKETSASTVNITPTVNAGTARYLAKAVIAGSSSNASATTTVAPGTVSISKQSTPSGVTNAASGDATTTAPSSGVYVAVKATAAANSTGTTSTISGSGSATVTTAGYAPSTLTGTVSVSGTATAKTSAKDSSMTYVPITTATPSFTGGALSGTATASSSTATISDSTNNSGVSFATACTATRANVTYNGNVAGWVSKASGATAFSSGSTALTSKTYYVNGVTITAPSSGTRTFAITVPNGGSDTVTFTFTVDANGNTTIE